MREFVSHATRHLVRRALKPDDGPPDDFEGVLQEISAAGWAIMISTLVLSFILYFLVDYTLHLIFTLAAVEDDAKAFLVQTFPQPPPYKDVASPTKNVASPTEDETAPLAGPSEDRNRQSVEDPEAVILTRKPITSSIRGTIRHLHSVGGFTARWRGFSMGFTWSFFYVFMDNFLASTLGLISSVVQSFAPFLSSFLARIVMSRWEMGWTHMMISQPSPKPWYRRTPPVNTWRNIWAPTALNHLARLVAMAIPVAGFFLLNMHNKFDSDKDQVHQSDGFKMLSLLAIWLLSYWIITLPANVALVRIQASLLPPEEDVIVPYDETFGGRVVSQAEGGKTVLGFAEAWRSLTREAKIRILKVVIKTIVIELAIVVLCGLLFVGELCYFVLPAVSRGSDDPDDSLRL